jgi:hypothetical protein
MKKATRYRGTEPKVLLHRQEAIPAGFYFPRDVHVDDRLKSQLERWRKDD